MKEDLHFHCHPPVLLLHLFPLSLPLQSLSWECSLEDYVTSLRRRWWRYGSNPFPIRLSNRKRGTGYTWIDGWIQLRNLRLPHTADVYKKTLFQGYILSTMSHWSSTHPGRSVFPSVCFVREVQTHPTASICSLENWKCSFEVRKWFDSESNRRAGSEANTACVFGCSISFGTVTDRTKLLGGTCAKTHL